MNEWLWIALYGGFFFLMMRYGCGAHMMGHHHSQHNHSDDESYSHHEGPRDSDRAIEGMVSAPVHGGKFVDPVCGMLVPRDEGYGKMFRSMPYRFCSRACLDKFDADPARYVPARAEHAA